MKAQIYDMCNPLTENSRETLPISERIHQIKQFNFVRLFVLEHLAPNHVVLFDANIL